MTVPQSTRHATAVCGSIVESRLREVVTELVTVQASITLGVESCKELVVLGQEVLGCSGPGFQPTVRHQRLRMAWRQRVRLILIAGLLVESLLVVSGECNAKR